MDGNVLKRSPFAACAALLTALAVALVVALTPATAMAAEGDVAQVGDTTYSTIADAIADAQDGDTITLLGNVTENVVIPDGSAVTIDLAGYTITNTDDLASSTGAITVEAGGNLTLVDTSADGTGTVDCVKHACAALVTEAGSTVTVEGGTLTRSAEASTGTSDSGGNSWYAVYNQGTLTFNGGTVTNEGYYSSLVCNFGTLTINDGTFSNHFIAIKNDERSGAVGQLYITGGTINSDDQALQNWGVAEISGGTLNGKVVAWAYTDIAGDSMVTISDDAVINGDVLSVNYMDSDVVPEVIITGGTVTGSINKGTHDGSAGIKISEPGYSGAEITISGGTFSESPASAFLDEGVGYTEAEDGTFSVVAVVITVEVEEGFTVNVNDDNMDVTEDMVLREVSLNVDGYTLSVDEDDLKAVNDALAAKETGEYKVTVYATKDGATEPSATAEVTVNLESLYVVTLITNIPGDDPITILTSSGASLESFDDPTYDGWVFAGWFTDEDLTNSYDVTQPITNDLTLYAGWLPADATGEEPPVDGGDDVTTPGDSSTDDANGGTTGNSSDATDDDTLVQTSDLVSLVGIGALAVAGISATGAGLVLRKRK